MWRIALIVFRSCRLFVQLWFTYSNKYEIGSNCIQHYSNSLSISIDLIPIRMSESHPSPTLICMCIQSINRSRIISRQGCVPTTPNANMNVRLRLLTVEIRTIYATVCLHSQSQSRSRPRLRIKHVNYRRLFAD